MCDESRVSPVQISSEMKVSSERRRSPASRENILFVKSNPYLSSIGRQSETIHHKTRGCETLGVTLKIYRCALFCYKRAPSQCALSTVTASKLDKKQYGNNIVRQVLKKSKL